MPRDVPGHAAVVDPESKAKFGALVWQPILRVHCAQCHESRVPTTHSSANLDVAYSEILGFGLVDFASAEKSRLYLRLAVRPCWMPSRRGCPRHRTHGPVVLSLKIEQLD